MKPFRAIHDRGALRPPLAARSRQRHRRRPRRGPGARRSDPAQKQGNAALQSVVVVPWWTGSAARAASRGWMISFRFATMKSKSKLPRRGCARSGAGCKPSRTNQYCRDPGSAPARRRRNRHPHESLLAHTEASWIRREHIESVLGPLAVTFADLQRPLRIRKRHGLAWTILRDQRVGREEEARDARRILKRRAHDLRGVDDAHLEQIAVLARWPRCSRTTPCPHALAPPRRRLPGPRSPRSGEAVPRSRDG